MHVGSDVPGRITRLPGGVVLNIAMALKAYGCNPALLSVVGQDDAGHELVSACDRLGLITSYLYRSQDLPTDQYMAIEGGNGLIAAIADAHSLEAAGDKILAPLRDGALQDWAGIIALDGNLTTELLGNIAQDPDFAEKDLRVAPASPGKAERLSAFLNHKAATVYLNKEEAELLLHRPFQTTHDAGRALVDQGLHRALVTDGPRAAASVSTKQSFTLTPPEVLVTRITGAGDTFMAAHIAAELRGEDEELALQSALDAAAIYISGESYR